MLKRLLQTILIMALLIASAMTGLMMRYPVHYEDIVYTNAESLEPVLIFSVIHAESKFRPEARSSKGAAGLMQITAPTADWMAKEMGLEGYAIDRIYDPGINIAIGCYYLNWLMQYYNGDLRLALCAYNAGIGNVNKWLRDERYSEDGATLTRIPFPETENYVKRVENNQKIYGLILSFRR